MGKIAELPPSMTPLAPGITPLKANALAQITGGMAWGQGYGAPPHPVMPMPTLPPPLVPMPHPPPPLAPMPSIPGPMPTLPRPR